MFLDGLRETDGIALQIGLLLLLLTTFLWFKVWQLWLTIRERRQLSQAVAPFPDTDGPSWLRWLQRLRLPRVPAVRSLRVVPGTTALVHPPRFDKTLQYLLAAEPHDRYRIPLGWWSSQGAYGLVRDALVGGCTHLLISGQSNAGKDNLATVLLFSLALVHEPNAIQICIIDGKGLDYYAWRAKAHVWGLALKPSDITPLLEAIRVERARRGDLLVQAGATKWEKYRGDDLPLLVVYVSELALLEDAVGQKRLTSWLNAELTAGRAFGIRYIIGVQSASHYERRWRNQISLSCAGHQPDDSQDEPNTGLSTKRLRALGATPPSALPPPARAPGVFTIVEGGTAVTVRVPYLDDDQLAHYLAQLPDRVSPKVARISHDMQDDQLLRTMLGQYEPGQREQQNQHETMGGPWVGAQDIGAVQPLNTELSAEPAEPASERDGTGLDTSSADVYLALAIRIQQGEMGVNRGLREQFGVKPGGNQAYQYHRAHLQAAQNRLATLLAAAPPSQNHTDEPLG